MSLHQILYFNNHMRKDTDIILKIMGSPGTTDLIFEHL